MHEKVKAYLVVEKVTGKSTLIFILDMLPRCLLGYASKKRKIAVTSALAREQKSMYYMNTNGKNTSVQ